MKKYTKYIIFAAIVAVLFIGKVSAASADIPFCEDESIMRAFKIGGVLLYAVKIVVPILLMLFGILTLFNVVLSGKTDDMSKAVHSIVTKAISAVVIFFIPTIVNYCFTLCDGFDDVESDFKTCMDCLYDPSKCGN